MQKVLIFIATVLLASSCLQADVEFAFAVPDDGRVTLGVFDSSGQLVRILHKLAKEEDFRIGLNGLITSWDGCDDAGARLPAGHYYVRGYLIGEDVRVSGEDYLFNDWAADAGFPDFTGIRDFSLLENGDLILLAGDASSGNLLARFSPEKGFLWSHKTGQASLLEAGADFPPLLASNGSVAVTVAPDGIALHSLDNGERLHLKPLENAVAPSALAVDTEHLFVSSKGGLTTFRLPQLDGEEISFPPRIFDTMDADKDELVGASGDGVWHGRKSFVPVPLPLGVKSISFGMPGTFWFVGEEAGSPIVGQASFGGEILRILRPAAEDPKPEKIHASQTSEKIAVLESLPGLHRLRMLARAETGEWTIEWERTLQNSSNFGFLNGVPVADAGTVTQEKEIRFRLKENPLTGKHDFLTLHAIFDKSGSALASPDGLPLVEVGSRSDIGRIAIHRGGNQDALRLLQGNGSFVEEFSITGLGDILPLDAGGIDLP